MGVTSRRLGEGLRVECIINHRVFSMLFGLWFWSWGKVRGLVVVRVIFRVRVMCIVGVRVRL